MFSKWPIRLASGRQEFCEAVVFGLGSMFNHSRRMQNVGWERDVDRKIITYRALRRIEAGEELCKSNACSFLLILFLDDLPMVGH